MNRIAIDEYRGWAISFDVEAERFWVASDQWDQEHDRGSFTACKKWIDEFIKANTEFKPVKIQKLQHGELTDIMTAVGIRKDGRFIVEDAKGERKQLSDYNLGDYIILDPRNEPIQKELKAVQARIKALQDEHRQLADSLHRVTMAQYKKSLGLDAVPAR